MGRVSARMRRSTWRRPSLRALLSAVRSCSPVLLVACILGIATAAAPAADTPPDPVGGAPAPPTAAPPPEPAMITPNQEVLNEIIVETTEPQFVAPTRRDRIGRIWAPVLIDGKGPYRLVLDTGANRSAITAHTAQLMGVLPSGDGSTVVTGFTGSARVPTIHVDHMEVGELLLGPTVLPILSDVFGGAQGVLGIEGLTGMRVYADFGRDRLVIARSHGERAGRDFTAVPLRLIRGGLLVADVHVGSVRAKAIVDTGAQGTIGNLMLRDALMRHPPRNVAHEEPLGLIARLGRQRLQRAQRRGMRHGDRRIGLQQCAVVLEERLIGQPATAGEELPRVRADRGALAFGEVVGVGQRVIDVGDQPVERLQPGPLGAGGDLAQPLEGRSWRREMALCLEQRSEHALQGGTALTKTVQPWTVRRHVLPRARGCPEAPR